MIFDTVFARYKADLELLTKCPTRLEYKKATSGAYHFIVYMADTPSIRKPWVTHFYVGPFPGCCGLAISFNAIVDGQFTNRGIGKLMQKMRIDIAKEWGYGALICTDIASHEAQNKIIEVNGWETIFNFKNPRTENHVNIYVKNLKNV